MGISKEVNQFIDKHYAEKELADLKVDLSSVRSTLINKDDELQTLKQLVREYRLRVISFVDNEVFEETVLGQLDEKLKQSIQEEE